MESALYSLFLVLRRHLVIGQFFSAQFFSAFHWSPSIGKPPMTGLLHQDYRIIRCVLLVTINQQTLYDSGILRQDYGIIPGLPMDHTRFADWVKNWVVYLLKQTKTMLT